MELVHENAVSNTDTAALARANAADSALRLVPVGEEAWDYCRALARDNMTPYLTRRGQTWSPEGWNEKAPSREFFEVFVNRNRIGFISFWRDNDANSVHIGDVQFEPEFRNRGYGKRTVERIFAIARSRGHREVTLNVFRDNPAIHLYERLGFEVIDHGFDKLKMRCALGKQRNDDGALLR